MSCSIIRNIHAGGDSKASAWHSRVFLYNMVNVLDVEGLLGHHFVHRIVKGEHQGVIVPRAAPLARHRHTSIAPYRSSSILCRSLRLCLCIKYHSVLHVGVNMPDKIPSDQTGQQLNPQPR